MKFVYFVCCCANVLRRDRGLVTCSGRCGRLLRSLMKLRLVGRPINVPKDAPAAIAIAMSTARSKLLSTALEETTFISPLYSVTPGTKGTIPALIIARLGMCCSREVSVPIKPTTSPAIALAGIADRPRPVIVKKIS